MRPAATSWYRDNFPYTIEISLSLKESSMPLKQWCMDFVSPEFKTWIYCTYISPQYIRFHFCFKHEEDALMFVLVHGGKIIES